LNDMVAAESDVLSGGKIRRLAAHDATRTCSDLF
jgi:hypothetical protein